MKKWSFYLLNIILICIILCNLCFLCLNILKVITDFYYIDNIQEDYIKIVKEKIHDNVIQNVDYISKLEVGDNFPTGVYNIKVSYVDKNGLEKNTIIYESTRHGEETPITNYIKEKGTLDISFRILYFLIICFSCIFIVLIIILNIKKNKLIKSKS